MIGIIDQNRVPQRWKCPLTQSVPRHDPVPKKTALHEQDSKP